MGPRVAKFIEAEHRMVVVRAGVGVGGWYGEFLFKKHSCSFAR